MFRAGFDMKLCALTDVFGDLVIYRDMNAMDVRLPRYGEAWHEMGMAGPNPPRKLDMAYAQALAWLLAQAQTIAGARRPALSEVFYLGDTLLSDGGAFQNLRSLTGWPGWCFIGSEKDQELQITGKDGLYQANRWIALADFLRQAQAEGAAIDQRTVAIVDIDKTAIGARGRNDKSIDRARLAAIEATLSEAVGEAFKRDEFLQVYAVLNTPKYHSFTADNQDNVAYICLMLSAGVVDLDAVLAQVHAQELTDSRQFMAHIDDLRGELTPKVRALHDDIYARTLAGDATPFKAFRRREYQETVDRMGHLPPDTHLGQRLIEEICITREVLEASLWLRERGCLMVALSDKPDEATTPPPLLAAQGYLPLHRTPTHVVGQSIELACH